ncbi:hypothetical protein SKAU_G00328760 [Synaphobranchus kaupii]|uniref:Uncharacterized protein n=1 Tax=Synaphobranchus kaupii TaxID=118154 RepID=A0A9Q1EQF2_SYNKA|nr:hypothetical protein SKAU_G00328760 [Synaphobranchus kaupii]
MTHVWRGRHGDVLNESPQDALRKSVRQALGPDGRERRARSAIRAIKQPSVLKPGGLTWCAEAAHLRFNMAAVATPGETAQSDRQHSGHTTNQPKSRGAFPRSPRGAR